MDWREQVNSYELKPARKLPTHPPFNVISSQGSRTRFPPDYYDIGPVKIKLICNFGGRFLPRPSDGELRYVGGDRHLIKINQYISWQELICKTTKFIRRAHMIKYHLPGEQVSMLISVTSDDDLRHMIDECLALGKSQERLTMYLFSGNDDERPTHFIVGSSSDAEKEAQFIALVNGFIRPGDELRTQSIGSSSMNRVDKLISGINGEELSACRTDETSQYIKSNPLQSITVRTKTSTGQLDKTPPSSQRRMTNQDYKAQSNAANMNSAVRNTINACHGSSVPTEIMYIAKKEQGADHAVSRHQPGLQRTTTNTSGESHQASGAQEKGSSRKQLLIPLDNSSVKVLSPNSKYNSPMPHTETSPSSPASVSRISQRTVNQESSDENTMNSRTYSIQEEATFRLEEEPLRKSGNFRLHSKMETSEPSHESDTPMRCNADIFEEKPSICKKAVATNSIQKQPHVVPATCSNTSKKGNPSVPISNSGEAAISYAFTSSDKTTDLQPNTLLRALSERIQERPSSPRQDEHSSKITRFRSVGTDNINHQISCPSEEAKDSAALLISELEVHETKSKEILPANAVLGRNLTSNVQIISNEDLEDLREMGSGAFGTVFHGKWKGTDVAIKRIKNSCFTYPSSQADKLITEFWREAAIISKLHHPNILALYGIVKNGPGGTLATVTEFMVNGSLKKVLLRRDKCLDWRKRIMVALDAAIGMEYLHSKDIVHFDLKCDNLLVNIKDPSRPICKVADFGLSKMKQATMVSGGMRGTLPWMAPELLTMSGTKVSEKVDVYSFGVVMWEILTGEDPYDGMHYGGVIGGILSNTLRPPVPTSCNPEWRKLMEQCWSTEPERRPSFTEVAFCLRGMLEASKSESLS